MTLHELRDHLEVVYGAVLAFVIVVLLTPAVAGMARRLADVQRERAGEDDERLLLRGVTVAASLRTGLVVPNVAAHVGEARAVAQLRDMPRRLSRLVGAGDPLELVRADEAKGRAIHYFVP